jgi:hypothetical protein
LVVKHNVSQGESLETYDLEKVYNDALNQNGFTNCDFKGLTAVEFVNMCRFFDAETFEDFLV